jgi:hypothetical protein
LREYEIKTLATQSSLGSGGTSQVPQAGVPAYGDLKWQGTTIMSNGTVYVKRLFVASE